MSSHDNGNKWSESPVFRASTVNVYSSPQPFDVFIFCICCFPHKPDSLALNYLPGPTLFSLLSPSLLCLSVSQSLPIISLPLFLWGLFIAALLWLYNSLKVRWEFVRGWVEVQQRSRGSRGWRKAMRREGRPRSGVAAPKTPRCAAEVAPDESRKSDFRTASNRG